MSPDCVIVNGFHEEVNIDTLDDVAKGTLSEIRLLFFNCIMQTEDIHYKLYEGRDKVSPDKEDRKETGRKGRKPGRKSTKVDMKAKLERSRQSARECRARKKLRYQYLEELVANRERAVLLLRKELEMYRQWCREIDEGRIPEGARKMVEKEKERKEQAVKKEEPVD